MRRYDRPRPKLYYPLLSLVGFPWRLKQEIPSIFVSLFHLPWKVPITLDFHWDYVIIEEYSFKTIARNFKIKWWGQFNFINVIKIN
jgi:hypothetical protein